MSENPNHFALIWLEQIKKKFSSIEGHFISNNHPTAIVYPWKRGDGFISSRKSDSILVFQAHLGLHKTVLSTIEKNNKNQKNHKNSNDEFSNTFSNFERNSEDNQKCPKVRNVSEGSTFISVEDNIVILKGGKVEVSMNGSQKNLIFLPLQAGNNHILFGTFFETILSVKYFILFVSNHWQELDNYNQINIKTAIYSYFIDSYISGSPYFITYGSDFIRFLQNKLPLTAIDLSPFLMSKILHLTTYGYATPEINNFIDEIQLIWEERDLLILKKHFPMFLTSLEKELILNLYPDSKSFDISETSKPTDEISQTKTSTSSYKIKKINKKINKKIKKKNKNKNNLRKRK